MFAVRDIMERNISVVYPETHILVAMTMMVKEGISGLPVVDKVNRLIGYISEKDVLSMLVDPETSDNRKVADYMNYNVKYFSPDDSAVDLCDYFMNHPIHVLPIVEDGEYVGVVRRRDIIFLILKIRGKIYKKTK